MNLEVEKHPNGNTKSVRVMQEGGLVSALFWVGFLVFVGLPILASIAVLFGVAFAVLWVVEKLSKTWYIITKPFRKPKPFRVPQTRIGRL